MGFSAGPSGIKIERKHYDARWNGEKYVIEELNLWSLSGNNWFDFVGYQKDFSRDPVEITLIGGVFDGEKRIQ